jgi:hypothetical protein
MTRWTGDLTRDDLLGLTPGEAFRDGLTVNRAGDAPPLETVCALALAYQANQEGAPHDVLGHAVAALGMVRDAAGPGALTAAAHDDLAQRLAFQAEGYPVTGAWLAALAAAATTGAELAIAQAFLVRTMDLAAAIMRDTRPP